MSIVTLKNIFLKYICVIGWLCIFINIVVAKEIRDIKDIEINKKETVQPLTNEKFLYQIKVSENAFFRLTLEKKDIYLKFKLSSPTKQIFFVAKKVAFDLEEFFWVTKEPGTYTIELETEGYISSVSKFAFTINKLSVPLEKEKLYITAEQITNDSPNILTNQDNKILEAHLEKLREALNIWNELGNQRKMCDVLTYIGHTNFLLGKREKALESFNNALKIAQLLEDKSKTGTIYNNLGLCSYYLGKIEQSLDFFGEGRKAFETIGDKRSLLTSYNNTASIMSIIGNNQKALNMFKEALNLAEELKFQERVGSLSVNIGSIYYYIGEIELSLSYYKKSLDISTETQDKVSEHERLIKIGEIYITLGEYEKALANFNKSLDVAININNNELKGLSLLASAETYISLKDYSKAKSILDKCLPILSEVDNKIKKVDLLANIALVQANLGDDLKAMEIYNEALSLAKVLKFKNREATLLREVGSIQKKLGNLDSALNHFNESLKIIDLISAKKEKSATLIELGKLNEIKNNKQEALKIYTECIELNRSTFDKSGEAIALFHLAKLESEVDLLDSALLHIEEALNLIEKSFREIKTESLKYTYSSLLQSYYELGISLYMKKHKLNPNGKYDIKAIELCENSRNKIFLQKVKELNIDINYGVDISLVNKKKLLEENFGKKSDYIINLLSNNKGISNQEEVEISKNQLKIILEQIESLNTKIKEESPQYASLTISNFLEFRHIQENIDKNTLLLNYYLGNDKSYLWLVSRSEVKSYVLPPARKIEDLTRQFLDAIRLHPSEKSTKAVAYKQLATGLGEILLGSVIDELREKKLVICGDGLIQIIPFGALAVANKQEKNSEYKPLIFTNEIISISSVSSVLLSRKELKQKIAPQGFLLAMGDPVYSPDDIRIKRNQSIQDRSEVAVNGLNLVDVKREDLFSRLLYSRAEVNSIIKLATGLNVELFTDFNANLENLLSKAQDYKYTHIATHGILNAVEPELSTLIMSLYNENGKRQEGFLTLNKVFSLKLNAELVTLSACQTGIGKRIRGEGNIGLTNAFLSVGARRVLSSLWSVSDEASAELMRRFYENLFQLGGSPSRALREAQISMVKEKKWQYPFFWAAFQLQGEWK